MEYEARTTGRIRISDDISGRVGVIGIMKEIDDKFYKRTRVAVPIYFNSGGLHYTDPNTGFIKNIQIDDGRIRWLKVNGIFIK